MVVTSASLILALDQGTTGSTAALYDRKTMRIVSEGSVDFPQHYPTPGWVEHASKDIWESMLKAIAVALERSGAHPREIAAIGITNQRETTLAWSRKSGQVIAPAIVWQDRRTAQFCEKLKQDRGTAAFVRRKTGLLLDPYFSATKMRWIFREVGKAKALARTRELCFGTVDSFLIWNLTGGGSYVTDHTNASRTMLYNLKKGRFDSDLCAIFEVPDHALPSVLPSAGFFGATRKVPGLPDGIPITGCLGDQQAALLGQQCLRPGEAKITYGTGAFALLNTGTTPIFSDDGLLTSVAFSTKERRTFALEGSAFIAGAAVQYLRDQFGWVSSAPESEALALRDPRDPNVLFVPAFTGLAAPHWNPRAKAALFGLTRGTSKSQIVRAVLESIALQNVQLLTMMKSAYGGRISRVGVDGGASQNDMLMQFQADVSGVKLVRPGNIETTSKGAALAAKIGLTPRAPAGIAEESKEFVPRMKRSEAESILTSWLAAVDAVHAFYAA